MNSITVVGNVSEQHLLSARVPENIPPGPITVLIVPSLSPDDETGNMWAKGVAQEWADDLGDSRQDIYSLDDGKPLDAS